MKSSGSSHERHSLAFAGRAAHARRVRLFSERHGVHPPLHRKSGQFAGRANEARTHKDAEEQERQDRSNR